MAPRFYRPFAFPASKLCLRRKNTVRSFSFSFRGMAVSGPARKKPVFVKVIGEVRRLPEGTPSARKNSFAFLFRQKKKLGGAGEEGKSQALSV
ncbi:hypothetical protein ABGM91_00830 [Akkermansia muciniphila]|uniref:hypothetical protein n=1 Tax=Akkermansia muciniphila TaxID=239935 RepID=UPI0033A9A397